VASKEHDPVHRPRDADVSRHGTKVAQGILRRSARHGQVRARLALAVIRSAADLTIELQREPSHTVGVLCQSQPDDTAAPVVDAATRGAGGNIEGSVTLGDRADGRCQTVNRRRLGGAKEDER
jgi:hypothetical protein